MNRKLSLFKICAVVAAAAFFAAGCSDDSSANCTDSCIDSGDTIDIPIPGDKTEGGSEAKSSSSAGKTASSSSVKEEAAVSSADEPASSETASEDWRDYCLEVVNAKRATEDLPPLERASEEREKCVATQAADDMDAGKGHANFGDCKESAQNSGPNINPKWYKTEKEIVDAYVNMMWDDEKKLVTNGERNPNKDSDYSYIGHYLNMKNARYKSLACGIAYSTDGTKAWFNMNFY